LLFNKTKKIALYEKEPDRRHPKNLFSRIKNFPTGTRKKPSKIQYQRKEKQKIQLAVSLHLLS
jgi:hypothetical protein